MSDNTHEAILQGIAEKINESANRQYAAWLRQKVGGDPFSQPYVTELDGMRELADHIYLIVREIPSKYPSEAYYYEILIDGDELVVMLVGGYVKDEDDALDDVWTIDRFCLSDPKSLDQLHTHLVKSGLRNLPEFKNG